MAKRKRSGKKPTPTNQAHRSTSHPQQQQQRNQPPQSTIQFDFDDSSLLYDADNTETADLGDGDNGNEVNYDDDTPNDDPTADGYVWGAKPLKQSATSGFSGRGAGGNGNTQKGYLDPSSNQRGAFPELQAFVDEEADLEMGSGQPVMDAVMYLRMVRHEARGVPSLLTASQPKPTVVESRITVATRPLIDPEPVETVGRPIPVDVDLLSYDDDNVVVADSKEASQLEAEKGTETGELTSAQDVKDAEEKESRHDQSAPAAEAVEEADEEDYTDFDYDDDYNSEDSSDGAFYSDGAYIALPTHTLSSLLSQTTQTSSLPARHLPPTWHTTLITNFHATRTAILSPSDDPPTETPTFSTNPNTWKDFLASNQPSTPLLQTLTSDTCIRIIKHLKRHLGWVNVEEWQGKWLWALLARVDEIGILMNPDVSVLREVGKKAAFNLGKVDEARLKRWEMGGGDWWVEEKVEDGLMGLVFGGGETNGDATANAPLEEDEEEGEDKEEPPAKKLAMFRPRSTVVSKFKSKQLGKGIPLPALGVPSISIIPATPAAALVVNDPLGMAATDATASQLLGEAGNMDVDTTADDAERQILGEAAAAEDTSATKGESRTSVVVGNGEVVDGEGSNLTSTTTNPTDTPEDINMTADNNIIPPTATPFSFSSILEQKKRELAAAAAAQKAEELPKRPDLKTLFALEMVVTIVGEVFGQRDLLGALSRTEGS